MKRTTTAKTLAVAIALIWLAWAGSYPGWGTAWMKNVNAILGSAAILATALLWWRLKHGPLTWPMLGMLLAMVITTVASDVPILSLQRLWVVITYAGGYFLATTYLDQLETERGIVLAGWLLFGVAAIEAIYMAALGGPARSELFGNANPWAMMIVGMAPVGLATLNGWRRWLWAGLAMAAMLAAGSRGAAVGMITGGIVALGLPWWLVAVVVAAGLPLALLRPVSMDHRLQLWRSALMIWIKNPIFGTGPGTSIIWAWWLGNGNGFWHAHNVVLTVMAESGLLGLAANGWLAARAWTLRARGWPWAILVGLAIAGLTDEPFLFGGPALLAILAAAQLCAMRHAPRVQGTV